MELRPRAFESIQALLAKGVSIPNPLTIDIGPEVDLDHISGDGVTINPGCRILGASTVISSGVTLGSAGPQTVQDCQLGPEVDLKGGYVAGSVFLRGANFGLGHEIRPGCLVEEEAGGAHTVGLKQTILFPFAILGSLINFCDALLAGGTSRSNHSEVGSSYIHFNFTPNGDKSTASLFGDVPRGVMLRQPPIFLGGQGGAVGPLRVGYGAVVGAGSVLRTDVADGQLALQATPDRKQRPFLAGQYPRLGQLIEHNLVYLANLSALRTWYRQARAVFFEHQEYGDLILAGALRVLDAATTERVKRLGALAGKVPSDNPVAAALGDAMDQLGLLFQDDSGLPDPPAVLLEQLAAAANSGTDYVAAVQSLPQPLVDEATGWLTGIVDSLLLDSNRLLRVAS